MSNDWDQLEGKLRELHYVVTAIKLLHWDQAALMPPAGAPERASAIAALETEAHRRLVEPEIGELIDKVGSNGSLDEKRAAHIRVLTRDYERATKVPEALVRELAEVQGLAYQAWTEARPADDFSILEPHLRKMFDLKKQEADAIGWEDERYDALLDDFEPGMTTAEVESMFSELIEGIKPLVDAAVYAAGDRPEFLVGAYDTERQQRFCEWLASRIGFDTEAGLVAQSPHPFTIQIAPGDVRQTIRTDPKTLLPSIYTTLHESGHALYEQGLPDDLAGLPAGRTPSLGMHESQSRLWENHVGRSRPFTDWLLPHLKELFEDQLGTVTPDEFYRAVNHTERGLIRVDADELTYNLHLILRFEIELAIFRDELDVADLPDAWSDKMEQHVGLRPDGDANGVLQDMHWAAGMPGYFPTYTLGTLYAAALFEKAEKDLGDLSPELREGETSRLLVWLRENIHSRAYLYPAKDLAELVLGTPLSPQPYLDYLHSKYEELYDISV